MVFKRLKTNVLCAVASVRSLFGGAARNAKDTSYGDGPNA